MTISGGRAVSASAIAFMVSARSYVNSMPPRRRWVTISRASSSLSSMISKRTGIVLSPSLPLGCRLVDEQPVHPQHAGRVDEVAEHHGLADKAVGAEPVGSGDIGILARGGQHDDRQRTGSGVGANAPQHLQPVDLGELDIQQHKRGVKCLPGVLGQEDLEGMRTVGGDDDLVAEVVLPEGPQRERHVVWIVIDKQNRFIVHGRCSDPGPSGVRVKKNVLPFPGSLSAQIRPPWRLRMRCTMASPMPLPSNSAAGCNRWNGSNSFPA